MNSPCLYCIRVKDPENCENKTCKDWQAWFLDRWEAMRENVRDQIKASPITEAGVPLGGHLYAHPHRVQSHLQCDPCDRCQNLKNLCQEPCSAKSRWNAMRNEVNL